MSTVDGQDGSAPGDASVGKVDMKLEAIVIPVADVDRSTELYRSLGWRKDVTPPGVVQFTPPGSGCSIQFGGGRTTAAPGSAQRTILVVTDLEAARDPLVAAGVEVSEIFHLGPDGRPPVPTPTAAATARWPSSAIPTATAGCCRRSPPGSPGASTPEPWGSARLATWPARSAGPPPPTASPTPTGPTGTPTAWSPSNPVQRCPRDQGERARGGT